jgi:competence ComEA-like helix-hairpin-helix protein
MNLGIRSFLGASLPRSQQGIILLLSLSLAGLWVWQTGLLSPSLPPIQSQKQSYLEIRGDIPCPGFQVFLSCPSFQEVWEAAGGRGILPNGSQLLTSGNRISFSSDRAVTLERMAGPDLLTLGLAIDPNRATAADLEAIPGIGPVLAGRIIEFREEQGPFQNIEALLAVKGLGPGKLKKIRTYLAVGEIKGELGGQRE